jgi:hypothetical protein
MDNGKKLSECATQNCLWRESAEAVMDGADFDKEVEYLSERLIYAVHQGAITVRQLRLGISWANALDKEAVQTYGSDLEGEQQVERTARRIMHHAGLVAFGEVRSPIKRLRYIMEQSRQENQVQ